MGAEIDYPALAVFLFFFILVTVMGFVAAHWRRPKTLAHIDEWGLGGRQFGTWITWFLVGGDFYTAYTVIAVPALVYAVGAFGFFALPYTIIVFPFVFAVMPLLWKVAKDNDYVTAADVVHGRYNSRWLEIAVAVTGVIATMPYIALQLIGMAAAIHALGIPGEIPLIAAFLVLAVYTYSSGLRAPALIAFVKDAMIYIVVFAAIALIPLKLGGYHAVFDAADAAFKAKGSGGILLAPSQYVAYASLAFGSAMAAFMYPHTLTAIFASSGADTIRKNAMLLPAYTLLLGLLALLGYMGHAAGLKLTNNNDVVPLLFKTLFPGWFAGFAFAAIVDRRAGSGGGDEHWRVEPLHPQFLEALCQSRHHARGRGESRQDHLDLRQDRRAAGDPLPADPIRARSAIARRPLDPPDLSGADLRLVHKLVPRAGPPRRLGDRISGRHGARLARQFQTAARVLLRRLQIRRLLRTAGARRQYSGRGPGDGSRAGLRKSRRLNERRAAGVADGRAQPVSWRRAVPVLTMMQIASAARREFVR